MELSRAPGMLRLSAEVEMTWASAVVGAGSVGSPTGIRSKGKPLGTTRGSRKHRSNAERQIWCDEK